MPSSFPKFDLLSLVSPELLKRLQATFTKTTGLPSIIVSVVEKSKGEWLTPATGCSQLCLEIRSSRGRKGEAACLMSDAKLATEAARKGVVWRKCHCKLVDFCAPILVAGTPVAAIFGGQLIFRDEETSARKSILKAASKYIPECKAQRLLGSIRVVGRAEFSRLLESAGAMAAAISELTTERYQSQLLQKLGTAATAARDVDEILDMILRTCREAIPDVTSGSILLRSSSEDVFIPRAWFGDFPMGNRCAFRPGEGYVGWVIEHGKPLNIADVRVRPWVKSEYRKIIAGHRMVSFLGVPLIAYPQSRLVGILELSSERPGAFYDEHVTLLSSAGHAAANLIQRRQESECISVIERTRDLDEMLRNAVEMVPEIFDGIGCSVFLLDRNSGKFTLRASRGLPANLIGRASYAPGQGLTGWVAKHGKSLRVPAGKKARTRESLGRIHPELEWNHRYRERSRFSRRKMVDRPFLAAPIKNPAQKTIGVLRISDRLGSGDFAEDNKNVLERICAHIGNVLELAERQRRLQETLLSERLNTVVLSAAGLAHEMMSPLSGVIYALDGLKRTADDTQRQKLESALHECKRIDASASRLLNLAARPADDWLGTGKSAVIDLVEITKEALQTVRYQFEVRCTIIEEAGIAMQPVDVRGDYYALQMVVLNMLVNAYEATDGASGLRRIRVKVGRRRHLGIIRISNTGRSIPKAMWNKVFVAGSTTKIGSTRRGLGLAICRRIIVDVHGGDIRLVASSPKKGTVFEIALPLWKAEK